MPDIPKFPGFPGGYCKIIGQIEDDGVVRPLQPPRITEADKTPEGLGRGDHTFGMPASYRPPEVEARLAKPRAPNKKGLKWWQQPGHLAQWGEREE